MKQTQVKVPWNDGLHARPAAKIVKMAHRFRADILIKLGDRSANARSILNILLLCASMGAVVDIEVHGDDEELAIQQIEAVFQDNSF